MKHAKNNYCKSCGSPRKYLSGKYILEIKSSKDALPFYLNKPINTFEEATSIRDKYILTGVHECTIYKTETFLNNESQSTS